MPNLPELPLPLGYQDWLFIGLVFLLLTWLLAFVALVAHVASEKGRSGVAWRFAAVVFSPLVALLALAAVPDKLGPVVVTVEDPRGGEDVPEFKWRKPGENT
jgi:hypothetical protein